MVYFIINKVDINFGFIGFEEWVEKEGILILGRIFYDRVVLESMSMLKFVVEVFLEVKVLKVIVEIVEVIKRDRKSVV